MTAEPNWVTQARACAVQSPARARVPLHLGDVAVGSVEAESFGQIGLQRLLDKRWQLSMEERDGAFAWVLRGDDPTAALNALAQALRHAGHCGPWRDEQLAVYDPQGQRIATIERGAVRVLGIATRAVHLLGYPSGGGHMWVQQRALTKPTHPGKWDTLMGGMVSAADTLDEALARETWEEAGLRIAELGDVAWGGAVQFAQPSEEAHGSGYMIERIDWYRAVVPAGMQPINQDGEVAQFALWSDAQMEEALARGEFTPEATLVMADALGW